MTNSPVYCSIVGFLFMPSQSLKGPTNSIATEVADADAELMSALSNGRVIGTTTHWPSFRPPVRQATLQPLANETPVAKVLRCGKIMLARTNRMDVVSCTFIERELIYGRLSKQQVALARVRRQLFSVSPDFPSPSSLAGKVAVWVESMRDGKTPGEWKWSAVGL